MSGSCSKNPFNFSLPALSGLSPNIGILIPKILIAVSLNLRSISYQLWLPLKGNLQCFPGAATKNLCGRGFIDRGNFRKLSPINFTCCCFRGAAENFRLQSLISAVKRPRSSNLHKCNFTTEWFSRIFWILVGHIHISAISNN